jgi:hypothetical protein
MQRLTHALLEVAKKADIDRTEKPTFTGPAWAIGALGFEIEKDLGSGVLYLNPLTGFQFAGISFRPNDLLQEARGQ